MKIIATVLILFSLIASTFAVTGIGSASPTNQFAYTITIPTNDLAAVVAPTTNNAGVWKFDAVNVYCNTNGIRTNDTGALDVTVSQTNWFLFSTIQRTNIPASGSLNVTNNVQTAANFCFFSFTLMNPAGETRFFLPVGAVPASPPQPDALNGYGLIGFRP